MVWYFTFTFYHLFLSASKSKVSHCGGMYLIMHSWLTRLITYLHYCLYCPSKCILSRRVQKCIWHWVILNAFHIFCSLSKEKPCFIIISNVQMDYHKASLHTCTAVSCHSQYNRLEKATAPAELFKTNKQFVHYWEAIAVLAGLAAFIPFY